MSSLQSAAIVFIASSLVACSSAPPAAESTDSHRVIYPEAMKPGAPFSPGVLAGKTLYLAGQVGRDPATREQPADIAEQTRLAMQNVGLILGEASLDFANLVSCRVQLTDMDNYTAMNEVYGSFFSEGRYPARTTLEVPALVGGAEIEVSCVAYEDASAIEIVRPSPDKIPPARGPYSPAVRAGDFVYLSGQGGREPMSGEIAETTEAQATQTLDNIGVMLEAAQLGFEHVVQADLYYPPSSDRSEIENAWKTRFSPGKTPSLGVVPLSRLPGDILVEITFLAAPEGASRLYSVGEAAGPLMTPAVLSGDVLYLSAFSKPEAGEGLEEQFRAILAEQESLLALAGMGFDSAVNANVYLRDVADFDAMNVIFREVFPEAPPARTTVGALLGDARIAVELTAVK